MQPRTKALLWTSSFVLFVLLTTNTAFAARRDTDRKGFVVGNVLQLLLPNSAAAQQASSSADVASTTQPHPVPDATQATTSSATSTDPILPQPDTKPDIPAPTSTSPQLPPAHESPKPPATTTPPNADTPDTNASTTPATTSAAIILPSSGTGALGNIYAAGLLSPRQAQRLFLLAALAGILGFLLAQHTILASVGRRLSQLFGSKQPVAEPRYRA